MVIGECLETATNQFGERRFYAPGQHRATYRERVLLDRLQRIWRIKPPFPDDTGLLDSIDYHRKRIEDFERGECRAKADYIEAMTPDPDEATLRVVARLRSDDPW